MGYRLRIVLEYDDGRLPVMQARFEGITNKRIGKQAVNRVVDYTAMFLAAKKQANGSK